MSLSVRKILQILDKRKALLQKLSQGEKEFVPTNLDNMSLPAKADVPLEQSQAFQFRSLIEAK